MSISALRLLVGSTCMLLIVGCAAGRPDSSALSASIQTAANADPNVSVTAEQADCIAENLLAGPLSDQTMNGLVEDFENPEVRTEEVEQVEPAVAEAAQICLAPAE